MLDYGGLGGPLGSSAEEIQMEKHVEFILQKGAATPHPFLDVMEESVHAGEDVTANDVTATANTGQDTVHTGQARASADDDVNTTEGTSPVASLN